MNNPDHISDSLETVSWVKFLDANPGSGMEKILKSFSVPYRKLQDKKIG
jgi:hypothetical protein